jgi:hypothetical protein
MKPSLERVYGSKAGGIFLKRFSSKRKIRDDQEAEPKLPAWDPIRCRPVYQRVTATGGGDATTDHTSSDDDDDEFEPKELEVTEQAKPLDLWHGLPKRKSKSYGTSRKPTWLPRSQTIAASVTHQSNSNVASTVFTSLTFASPSPLHPSSLVCNMFQSSTTTRTTQHTIHKAQVKHATAIETKQADGMILKKRRRVTSNRQEPDSFDFPTKQPHCHTTVSQAKSYFDQLDATQALQLRAAVDDATGPEKCGRTVQPFNLTCAILWKEYDTYSRASRESGVTPMSLPEYAKHRSTVFRPKDLFDGFFDG